MWDVPGNLLIHPGNANIDPENDGWKITFLLGRLILRGKQLNFMGVKGCHLLRVAWFAGTFRFVDGMLPWYAIDR